VAPTERETRLYQRVVAGVVTLALVLGLVPTAALADEVVQPAVTETTEQQVVKSTDETADSQTDASAEQSSDDSGTGSDPVVETVDVTSQEKVSVTATIVGADGSVWATQAETLDKGATAADAFEELAKQAGITADHDVDPTYGWSLNTITDPASGDALGYDATSGKFWQLFHNGSAASLGAGGIILAEGDSVVWYYSAWGESLPQEKVSVTATIIGVDANGNDETWAKPVTITLDKGATAADLTEQLLSQAQLSASYGNSTYGWYLSTITSPDGGRTLGYDATSGKYWQLFHNGSAASLGAGGIILAEGDSVVWYYSAWGESLPDNPDKPVSGGVTAPDTASEWPETETAGNVTTAPTSSASTTVSWMVDLKNEGSLWASVSEPLIVDGKLVVAVDGTLKLISNTSSTAAVEKALALDGSIDYTARPVYADGVIYVPLSGGAVEAVDYGTFSKLWTSEKTAEKEQSSCSLRVVDLDGKKAVVFGTAAYGPSYSIASGSLLALDAATGTTVWAKKSTTSGWYWTGVLRVGDYLLAGDAAGTMCAYALDGTEISSLSLGAAVNSDPVAYGDGALVVTRDGVLHKLSLSSSGQLTDVSLKVLDGCTAAPTVTGTTAVVVGDTGDQGGTTTLALVDLSSMTVTRTVTSAGGTALSAGAIKAPALVSIQSSGTYAYFTVNCSGGNLYVYKLGDLEASLLYAPSSANANYCDSPVICDAAGNLYYLNDSGFLVRLSAADAGGNGGNGGDNGGSGSASGTGGQDTTTSSSLFSNLRSSDVTSTEETTDSAGVAAQSTDGTGTGEYGVVLTSEAPSGNAAGAVDTTLPVWPIVGMAAGVAVLLWALLGRRRGNGGEGA